MNSHYNAVVVGAGPSGLTAALDIAKSGFSVLLLEKRTEIGLPVFCAEGVPRRSFELEAGLRPEWISCNIDMAKLVSGTGNNCSISFPNAGIILNRHKFESDLSIDAINAGVDLQLQTMGLKLIRRNNKFDSLIVQKRGESPVEITADIFIAGDGVESRIARAAGIDNKINLKDVESILQYRLSGIEVSNNTIELHVGREIAPGGYAWVFPKSKTEANVGLGICVKGDRGELCRRYLDDFVSRRFKGNGNIEFVSSGMTPKYQGKDKFQKDNLLVTGDASRALDSISGAGIVNAIAGGHTAAEAALKYLRNEIDIKKISKIYPKEFLKKKQGELEIYLKLRKAFVHMNDDDFNEIINALKKQFNNGVAVQFNPARLLINIIKTRPRLLGLVRYLL